MMRTVTKFRGQTTGNLRSVEEKVDHVEEKVDKVEEKVDQMRSEMVREMAELRSLIQNLQPAPASKSRLTK